MLHEELLVDITIMEKPCREVCALISPFTPKKGYLVVATERESAHALQTSHYITALNASHRRVCIHTTPPIIIIMMFYTLIICKLQNLWFGRTS